MSHKTFPPLEGAVRLIASPSFQLYLLLIQLKYVISLYFIIILCTSCYSLSSVSLHLYTGYHLQSTIYNLYCSLSFDMSSDKIMGSLLIDSDNETEVLEICNEDSKTHSSSDIVIWYDKYKCNVTLYHNAILLIYLLLYLFIKFPVLLMRHYKVIIGVNQNLGKSRPTYSIFF